jgi:apoptosis-inducing factor 3
VSDEATARDLTRGIPISELADGVIVAGRVGDDDVLVVRKGEDIFAVGARCTHYHGPLAEGLVVGDTVRCPWHHACFSLRTGEAVRTPALDPVACWRVDQQDGQIYVREKLPEPTKPAARGRDRWPESVVIVGGGAAALSAADMLRREGYDRAITMISADEAPPSDRPNLSKDYLAGKAQEDWIPLRGSEFYAERGIDLKLGSRVSSIDLQSRHVRVDGGGHYPFGALLIATGAEPLRLTVPGSDQAHVHYLRSLADSNGIIAAASTARKAVVIGAGFIGLEVAASLRTRGLEVDVVAPEPRPMERILGPQLGASIQRTHESHGVRFHLERTVARVDGPRVILSDRSLLETDVVVVGIGVRPLVSLAADAGLATDRGISVDEYLQTSFAGVYAAGDIARWPDRHSGARIRVEHWVVAERQGQTAGRNMLGKQERFDAVPFFWSQHYDVVINYVGHAEAWDAIEVDGHPEDNDCAVTYRQQGRRVAVATIFRDKRSLEVEAEMEGESPIVNP